MDRTSTASIRAWVSKHFDLDHPLEVGLVRAYTNDVFLISGGAGERRVLKVYGPGWRSDSDVLYEIALTEHLSSKGIGVARAVSGKNGEVLQHIHIHGALRQAVLSEYAAGGKPVPPFTLDMYHREGRAAAALHLAADDFSSPHRRRGIDLAYLIDDPLTLVESACPQNDDVLFIHRFGKRLRAGIERHIDRGLDWGVCHGDLTFDNFHLTRDHETVWYDFDSGGPGWRGMDLQGWAALNDDFVERGRAFVLGYREIRPLGQNDVEAAPSLFAATELWGIEVDLRNRILAEGDQAIRLYLSGAAEKLREWSDYLGFTP